MIIYFCGFMALAIVIWFIFYIKQIINSRKVKTDKSVKSASTVKAKEHLKTDANSTVNAEAKIKKPHLTGYPNGTRKVTTNSTRRTYQPHLHPHPCRMEHDSIAEEFGEEIVMDIVEDTMYSNAQEQTNVNEYTYAEAPANPVPSASYSSSTDSSSYSSSNDSGYSGSCDSGGFDCGSSFDD